MKYLYFFTAFLITSTAYSAEVVSCSKDYSNSDVHETSQLKNLKIKFESYTPGTSLGALRAKGQIGYAGIRSEIKRVHTVNNLIYKSFLSNDFLLVLKDNKSGNYSGELTLSKGSSFERVLKDLKCSVTGQLPEPKTCELTQEKIDLSLFNSLLTSDLDEVNFALECGANPNSTDKVGCTPLLHLLDPLCGTKLTRPFFSIGPLKQTQMASIIIDAGSNLENADPINEQTALHKTTLAGNSDVAMMLVELEANIDAQDTKMETALMYAVRSNNYFLVRDLVNANANIDLKNKAGKTAYQMAMNLNLTGIAELLLPVKQTINIEGSANSIGCSVSTIELNVNEAVEFVLKAKRKMLLLESLELGLELMAMPNEGVKTRFTALKPGTFEFTCGPHGGPIDQQTKGTIVVK